MMDSIIQAVVSVPVQVYVKYAAVGAVLGALLTPLLIFVAIKINYRRLGQAYAGFAQTGEFYRLFAKAGAALFALLAASQPALDAARDNEVYIRGAMIPLIMVVIGVPFVRSLKRFRHPAA